MAFLVQSLYRNGFKCVGLLTVCVVMFVVALLLLLAATYHRIWEGGDEFRDVDGLTFLVFC